MTYWVKVDYERKKFVVDLERISSFVCAPNGRITFWLPDSSIPVIINKNTHPDDYNQVIEYINQLFGSPFGGAWLRLFYERNEFVIDLSKISSFCYSERDKITFWLPDSATPIVISKQNDPNDYQRLLDFVSTKTGYSLP